MNLTYKPMQIEPLFWAIMGLPVQGEVDISSRLRSAWTVNAPVLANHQRHGLVHVNELADLTFEWTQRWPNEQAEMLDLEDMLTRLGDLAELSVSDQTLAICLSILNGNLTSAEQLCASQAVRSDGSSEGGPSIITVTADGTRHTFIDKARAWLATERRRSIRLV